MVPTSHFINPLVDKQINNVNESNLECMHITSWLLITQSSYIPKEYEYFRQQKPKLHIKQQFSLKFFPFPKT